MILYVDVVNKIATFQKRGGRIVCGNSDYKIKFSFDSEWDSYTKKTVRFIWGGQYTDVDITGDMCDVPVLYDTAEVEVGVYAGDLKTTTSAFIGCYRSILCEVAKPSEENDRNYVNEAKVEADRAEVAAEEATKRVEEAVKFSTDKVEAATNEAAERAEAAAAEATGRVEEAVKFATDKVEAATSEAADRAEDAAVRAEEAADRAEAEGGISTELDNRLKILEKWMNNEVNYEPIKFNSFNMEPSTTQYEYGYSVPGIKLTWELNRSATKITVNGKQLEDPNATTYEADGPFTTDQSWTVVATDEKGATASMSKSITFAYESIKFKSFTMEPSDTKYEHGVAVANIKLQWELNRAATKITVNDVEINKTATEYEETGPFTTDQSWEVIVTGAKGETAKKTAEIDFYYYRVYWGLGTQEKEFDSDFVKSLGSSELATTKAKKLTFSSANDQYVYYVIPTALGTPTFQIGEFAIESGFEPGVKIPVETGFTDIKGNPITLDYNLYRSSNLLTNDESFNVYAK